MYTVTAGNKVHYTTTKMVTLCGYIIKGKWTLGPFEAPTKFMCRTCAGLLKVRQAEVEEMNSQFNNKVNEE